jgi:ribosomal protein S18 acetylase RimI-like enzyme
MHWEYRPARWTDVPECIRIRGLTRENAVPEERLRALGITAESWAGDVSTGDLPGFVCTADSYMAGYCFGASKTGEVIVLAVLPAYESQGIGRQLLNLVVAQ